VNANEFTWKQRGAIDYIIGVSFGNCSAENLFDRDEWEKGWQEQHEVTAQRFLRVTGYPANIVRGKLHNDGSMLFHPFSK